MIDCKKKVITITQKIITCVVCHWPPTCLTRSASVCVSRRRADSTRLRLDATITKILTFICFREIIFGDLFKEFFFFFEGRTTTTTITEFQSRLEIIAKINWNNVGEIFHLFIHFRRLRITTSELMQKNRE